MTTRRIKNGSKHVPSVASTLQINGTFLCLNAPQIWNALHCCLRQKITCSFTVTVLSSVYYYFEVVGSEDFRQDVTRFYGARETNLTKKINASLGQKKKAEDKIFVCKFSKKCPC